MAKYWGIPLNWACKKIQTNHDIMNHSYEVIDALTKHEHNLQSILEYHMNPFPNICSQAVHLAVWLYLLMSTYASQFCDGGKHHLLWLIFGVSLKFQTKQIIHFHAFRTYQSSQLLWWLSCLLCYEWLRSAKVLFTTVYIMT